MEGLVVDLVVGLGLVCVLVEVGGWVYVVEDFYLEAWSCAWSTGTTTTHASNGGSCFVLEGSALENFSEILFLLPDQLLLLVQIP